MMRSVPVPGELIEFIRSGSKFIIVGHKEPDGDCVGSELALCSALRRLGKEVIPCSAGPFKRTEIAKYQDIFKTAPDEADKANARILIVDCSDLSRTGNIAPHLEGIPLAYIDHHASGQDNPIKKTALAYMDCDSPSATLLILEVIKALGLEPTKEEANFLLFGLCTDTGFFRHIDNNGEEIFLKAAELLKAGASPKNTFNAIHGGKSYNSRILLGRILSRSQLYFDGHLVLTYEDNNDICTLGHESRDSDMLFQLLQSITGVDAFVLIRQEKANECSVALRSRHGVNVGAIAEALGGGGHKNAAGFTIDGEIPDIEKIILEKFKDVF